MSPTPPPYRERIAAAVHHEFGGDERLLAATRLSLPLTRSKVDEHGKEQTGLGLSLLQHYVSIIRKPPPPVPGFPVSWEMVAALTPQRIVVWTPRRGGEQPGGLLGAVPMSDLQDVVLATVPARGGRTLAAKFVLRSGPRVMLDVVAGFRADSEQFVDEVQRLLAARQR